MDEAIYFNETSDYFKMLIFLSSRGEAWEGLGVRDREGRTDSGQE